MESGRTSYMVILNNNARILIVILHVDYQNRQEMYFSVRVHPIFVTRENLSIVLQPFDFNKRLICFTLKGNHGVLLFGFGIFHLFSEINNLLG